MTGYRHAPSRLPMNKLKSLLQKTRKVTRFVWKSIRKNTPLSSEIHYYVKNRKGLYLNRYRSNCNTMCEVFTEGATPKLVRKRGKVYLSSKHQSTGDLGGMTYPNSLLSKNLPLCTCNYPFYSPYNSLNHRVNFGQFKLCTNIEKDPGVLLYINVREFDLSQ